MAACVEALLSIGSTPCCAFSVVLAPVPLGQQRHCKSAEGKAKARCVAECESALLSLKCYCSGRSAEPCGALQYKLTAAQWNCIGRLSEIAAALDHHGSQRAKGAASQGACNYRAKGDGRMCLGSRRRLASNHVSLTLKAAPRIMLRSQLVLFQQQPLRLHAKWAAAQC